ncbi:MAG: hypothetical protein IJ424_02020 [Oscillospiraceae bacterium]|nr:hypothetical protein [Oscillospiraceae bacterium]
MEEKTKKTKKFSFRDSKVANAVFSFVIAVVLWFVLTLTAFPEISIVIKNVPIDFSLDGSYADVAGLSIVNLEDTTVNVKLSGLRYVIGDYTAEDLKVSLNLDAVRASGSYELALNVSSVNGDSITIDEIGPETVHVEFDHLITKTFSVADGTLAADLSKVKAQMGYILDADEVTITPSEVTVSGPKDYVDQVTSCVITFNDEYVFNKPTNSSNTTPILYSSGAVFENPKVTLDTETFNVLVPVYMKKALNLDVEVQPSFDSFDLSSLSYTITPPGITVRTQDESVENLSEIFLGYIDLRQVGLGINSVFEFDIPESDRYTNISGNETAQVIFNLDGYASKDITIPNSRIYFINVPENYRCTVEQEKIRNVTVVGPAEIINQIDVSDVVAQIDLSDYNVVEGDQIMTVTVYLPNYNNVWCMGIHKVYCSISEVVPVATEEPEDEDVAENGDEAAQQPNE